MPAIRTQLLALVALAGLVLLIAHLIVTDEEAIRALADEAAAAAEARDFERLEALLAQGFRHGTRDRTETIARVRSLMTRYRPASIEVVLYDVKVDEDRATATAVVSAQVVGRPVRQRVELTFVETEDEGWRLLRAKGGRYPR